MDFHSLLLKFTVFLDKNLLKYPEVIYVNQKCCNLKHEFCQGITCSGVVIRAGVCIEQ